MAEGPRWLLARAPSDKRPGETKDWAIAVIGETVQVRYGATGTRLRRQEILRGSWTEPTARREAQRRLEQQAASDGYQVVGTCRFAATGDVVDLDPDPTASVPDQALTAAEEAAKPQNAVAVFCEVMAPSWLDLAGLMEEVVGAMAPHLPVTWVGRQGLTTSVPSIGGWAFTFAGHEGSGPVAWAGEIPVAAGPGALLFVLGLRARAQGGVTVSVADADGNDFPKDAREHPLVSPHASRGTPLRQAAEALGVISKDLALSEIASTRFRKMSL